MKLKRTSFTVPPDLLENLDYISGRLGVSRSALVGQLLGEPVAELRKLLEAVPEAPSPADMVRLRGESVEVVEQRLDSLRRLGNDLFSDNN